MNFTKTQIQNIPVKVLKTTLQAEIDPETKVSYDLQLSMIEIEREHRSVYTQFIDDKITLQDFAAYCGRVKQHFSN